MPDRQGKRLVPPKRDRKKGLRTFASRLLLASVFVASLWFVWKQPQRQAAGTPAASYRTQVNDARRTNTQMLGAAFLLLGTWLTWRNFLALKEGRVTDRLTKALDALGSERQAARIGALLALERVAREAPIEHQLIMEAIAADIRQRCHFKVPWSTHYVSRTELMNTKGWDPYAPDAFANHPTVAPDVQVALDVFRRRIHERDERPLDLSSVHLRDAFLQDIHLERCNLVGSTLEGADIKGAHFEGATAKDVCFDGTHGTAHFEDAQLDHSSFWDAEIDGSHFERAHAWGCLFTETELRKAQFMGCDLDGVKMSGALLNDADFTGADLRHADLRMAKGVTTDQLRKARSLNNAQC